MSSMGSLHFEYGQDQQCWEVVIYPSAVELVGTAQDGEIVAPGCELDLEGLRATFDAIHAMGRNRWDRPTTGHTCSLRASSQGKRYLYG